MELWISLIAGASGGGMPARASGKKPGGFWMCSALGAVGGLLVALALMQAGISPMRDGGVDLVSLFGQITVTGLGGALLVSAVMRLKRARKR